jgi:hypothetical protein
MITLMAPAAKPMPRAADGDRLGEYGEEVADGGVVGVERNVVSCPKDVDAATSFVDMAIVKAPMIVEFKDTPNGSLCPDHEDVLGLTKLVPVQLRKWVLFR